MKAKILWVEGKRANGPSFIPIVRKKDYIVDVVTTGKEALSRLKEFDPDLAIVNAMSLRSSGRRICCNIQASSDNLPILLLANVESPVGSSDDCANTVLKEPFSQRKLTNRIAQLLPGDGKLLMHAGPIRLDLEKRRVRCCGRNANLTPRLALILQILMKNHGEVVEREDLFRQAWQTDYVGDTRSLDVHISWLREAIEEDARRPRFLKTIRGVGYRLDA